MWTWMKHLIALSVLLLGGCSEKEEVADSGTNGNGKSKVGPVEADPDSGESSDAGPSLESQVLGYWAATAEDMVKNVEEKDSRKLSPEEQAELRASMEKGEFGLLLHFPAEGKMIGYMTGRESSTMTYEVTSVDDSNGVRTVEVDGDAGQFSGKITFGQDKLVLTRDDEEGSMTVSRIDRAEFARLVPGIKD